MKIRTPEQHRRIRPCEAACVCVGGGARGLECADAIIVSLFCCLIAVANDRK